MVLNDDRFLNPQKEMTVNFKRVILLTSVLGLLSMTLSAQQPVPRPAGTPTPPGVLARDPAIGGFGAIDEFQNGWATGFGGAYGQNAEEMQLAHQCQSLVKQLAKAEGADKDKIKAQLSEAIDKQFDLRQKRHESEITALENQLKKLKETVQKRQENRKDIVSKRLEQLIRESEGLGW